MMNDKHYFICPTCNEKFSTEEKIQKHFLSCWKERHPFYQSKSAPRSNDIITREISDDVMNFFNSFKED